MSQVRSLGDANATMFEFCVADLDKWDVEICDVAIQIAHGKYAK
jgi:hypothetical protein